VAAWRTARNVIEGSVLLCFGSAWRFVGERGRFSFGIFLVKYMVSH
jgi:hypothetical protein